MALGAPRKGKDAAGAGFEAPCTSMDALLTNLVSFRTLRVSHDLKRPPFHEYLRAPCSW
jgi:hypothetical protein